MRPMLKQLATLIGTGIRDAVNPLREKTASLEERIAALEHQSKATLADAYCGSHVLNRKYWRGEIVTRSGGTWLALQDTQSTPGQSAAWKLIAKGSGE